MTKETAIKVLRHEKNTSCFDANKNEALIMAIEALKQMPNEKKNYSMNSTYWIHGTVNDICARCGGRGTSAFDYCPHCGRKAVK